MSVCVVGWGGAADLCWWLRCRVGGLRRPGGRGRGQGRVAIAQQTLQRFWPRRAIVLLHPTGATAAARAGISDAVVGTHPGRTRTTRCALCACVRNSIESSLFSPCR